MYVIKYDKIRLQRVLLSWKLENNNANARIQVSVYYFIRKTDNDTILYVMGAKYFFILGQTGFNIAIHATIPSEVSDYKCGCKVNTCLYIQKWNVELPFWDCNRGQEIDTRQLLQRELGVLQDICFSVFKQRCKTFATAWTRGVSRYYIARSVETACTEIQSIQVGHYINALRARPCIATKRISGLWPVVPHTRQDTAVSN